MKLTKRVKRLLFEAYRRYDMADDSEKNQPLTGQWLGLGTEAAYRPIIEAGYMVFHDGRTPPRGCMGWLCLTEKGVEAITELWPELATALKRLKRDPVYKESYISHYMLAGGLVKRS